LGFDSVVALPDLPTFRRFFGERRSILKALLLDQTFAAGVGNWIADEVLYQARLDPRRRTAGLEPAEVARLHRALGRVDARADRFPKGWLFHRRWGRDPEARTVGGERIVHATVAGRTTAWVPAVQG
jgi:formamidopyrimidine-DNA glycosylase